MPRPVLALLLTLSLTAASLALPSPAHAVYFVDTGDSISIQVKDANQYSYSGPIRPDGAITIPFLGDLEVAGLTTSQVEQKVATALKAFLRNPDVSVNVTGFRPQFVTLLGEVSSPGVIQIPRPKATLFDVLAAAGGLTERAVASEVVVIRGNGASAKRFIVNVEEMMRTADFTNNLVIEPGDRIQVREVWWPNLAEWRRDLMTVMSIIASVSAILIIYDRASRQ